MVIAFCFNWCTAGLSALLQTESRDAYAEAASAFEQGQLDQAEEKLRGAIAVDPNRPDLLGLLGLVLDAKKEYLQAEPFHQRALKLAPRSAGLWNNFGNHHLERGNDQQAREAFEQVLAIDPGHANANLQLARIALSQNHGGQALRYLSNLKASDQSDPAAVDTAFAFAERLGKQPIRCNDTPGFVVNRILIPLLNDCVRVLDEARVTPADLDAGLKNGAGWPMGPCELVDLVGIDVHVHASEALWEKLREPRMAPPARLVAMANAGLLGRKSGRGFYSYDD